MAQTRNKTGIRRGRKFAQVLEGARVVFLRDGFEGASVDDIAAEAGVSKATLYSYFPDKKLLFLEAAKSECALRADVSRQTLRPDMPAPELLRFVGNKIVEFISSDFGLAMFRIGVAESARFPEIGREFFQSGPMLLRANLGAYLCDAVARGELVIDDCEFAAEQFAKLCSVEIQDRLIYGMQSAISRAEARRIVDAAIEMFLARYGVKRPVAAG